MMTAIRETLLTGLLALAGGVHVRMRPRGLQACARIPGRPARLDAGPVAAGSELPGGSATPCPGPGHSQQGEPLPIKAKCGQCRSEATTIPWQDSILPQARADWSCTPVHRRALRSQRMLAPTAWANRAFQ